MQKRSPCSYILLLFMAILSCVSDQTENSDSFEIQFMPLLRDRITSQQKNDTDTSHPFLSAFDTFDAIDAQTEEKRKQFIHDYLTSSLHVEATIIDKTSKKQYHPLQIIRERGAVAFSRIPYADYQLFVTIRSAPAAPEDNAKDKNINFIGYQETFSFRKGLKQIYLPIFRSADVPIYFHFPASQTLDTDTAVFTIEADYFLDDNTFQTLSFNFDHLSSHPLIQRNDENFISMLLPLGHYQFDVLAEISGSRYITKPHQRLSIIDTLSKSELHFSLEPAILDNIQAKPYFSPVLDHYEFQYDYQAAEDEKLMLCPYDSNGDPIENHASTIFIKTQTPELIQISSSTFLFEPDDNNSCMTINQYPTKYISISKISSNNQYSANIEAILAKNEAVPAEIQPHTFPSGNFWFNVMPPSKSYDTQTFNSIKIYKPKTGIHSIIPSSPQAISLSLFQGDFVAENFEGYVQLATDTIGVSFITQATFQQSFRGNLWISNALQYENHNQGEPMQSIIQASETDSHNQTITVYTSLNREPLPDLEDSFHALLISAEPNEWILSLLPENKTLSGNIYLLLFDNDTLWYESAFDSNLFLLSVSALSDELMEIPLVLPSNLSDYITSNDDPMISNGRVELSIPVSDILDDGLFALQNLTKNSDTLLKLTVSSSEHPMSLSDTLLVRIRMITTDTTP